MTTRRWLAVMFVAVLAGACDSDSGEDNGAAIATTSTTTTGGGATTTTAAVTG